MNKVLNPTYRTLCCCIIVLLSPYSVHPLSQPNRRNVIQNGAFGLASLLTTIETTTPLNAKAAESTKAKEFVNVGTQAPPPDGESAFVELSNGVKIKDFRLGTGDEVVKENSQSVMVQCTGRLLNLNGVVFYSTKNNNNSDGFGAAPLTINLGKGEVIPGLENGLVGMKKGGIRRLIVPADLAYSKYPDLEPKPVNANDQRALDSVVKNTRRDATIMFDVQVERFK
jgi:FKBP-type peptidyl-prolyl cis-trans isomerase